MKLYHGSNVLITQPKIINSGKKLDFGKAFYLTTDYEQASRWAQLKTKRIGTGTAIVSIFDCESQSLDLLKTITFLKPDKKWLETVTHYRIKEGYEMDFDVIIGPVADDDTVRTIRRYFDGTYTEEETLRRLLPQKLKDQYAFKTEFALEKLTFAGSDDV